MNYENTCLGLELGSTRIKAVTIDENHVPVSSGDYTWASSYENGIWTYSLEEVWQGLKTAVSGIANPGSVKAMGVSAMMHGYLAFDKDWNLLVPFRTWQNTITAQAARELTEAFRFNIPQRWSIAHLYQAVLNQEPHVPQIAHITTLAGYVHYMLTGVNAVGVGEASGIFPIDSDTNGYDEGMMVKMEEILAKYNLPWNVRDVLPGVLVAGEPAGKLTAEGAALLGGVLPEGIPFAPAEGDAGTGMTATNAVAPKTGNVSAGTSIFSMVVLEKPLSQVHEEIDLVTTPTGKAVAMVHCNNCTNDMNAWVKVLRETVELFGGSVTTNDLYTKLYQKSLEGDVDCGGVTTYNYMAGGLCITALISYLIANTSAIKLFFTVAPNGAVGMSGLSWLALLAPFIMIFAFGWVLSRGTLAQVQGVYWGYAAVMGAALAPVFIAYTGTSITRIFLITAAMFGGRVKEVPVVMRERQGGVSSISSFKSAYYMIKVSLALIIDRFSITKARGGKG